MGGGGEKDSVHPACQKGVDGGSPGFGAGGRGDIDDDEVVAAGAGGLVRAENDAPYVGAGANVLADHPQQACPAGPQGACHAVRTVPQLPRSSLNPRPGFRADPGRGHIVQDVGDSCRGDAGGGRYVPDADGLAAGLVTAYVAAQRSPPFG